MSSSPARRQDGEAGAAPSGMIRLSAGRVRMGSERHYREEAPIRDVSVGAFAIDASPVTNRQFAAFVQETGYVTVAERSLDPAAYPGVAPAQLVPGALVFRQPAAATPVHRSEAWWRYQPGAYWRRPEAAASVVEGRLDHPVSCVAYEDAETYARWAGKALPTEAQWEYAARGGREGSVFAWGDEFMPGGCRMANTWPGDRFPFDDRRPLPPYRTTAVGSFPPNDFGLYDMIGNVWEWTADWFTIRREAPSTAECCGAPPVESYDPVLPEVRIGRRVVKGGSFLCAPNACARYRPAARQPQMIDTASVHLGFRCVSLPQEVR